MGPGMSTKTITTDLPYHGVLTTDATSAIWPGQATVLSSPPKKPDYSSFRTGRKAAIKNRQIKALSGSLDDAVKLTCLYNGMPTAIFELLLRAARGPVAIPKQAVKPLGAASMSMSVPSWFMSLVSNQYLERVGYSKKYTVVQTIWSAAGKVSGVHNSYRYALTHKGVDLLQAMAKKRKEFAPYVQAYMPDKRAKALKADMVLRKIVNDKA